MTPTDADAGVVARRFDELGVVQLGAASSRVIAVAFPDRVPDDAVTDHVLLDRIGDYLDGTRETFADVTVAFTVPADQRAVLAAVREIPYGETVEPRVLARTAAGLDSDDTDTVRAALEANPAPLVVPDHRVRGAVGATPTRVASVCRAVESID